MKINRTDINFLYALYRYRCLTLQQVNRFFYHGANYYKEKVVPLIDARLIDLNIVQDLYTVSITQKGIDLFCQYLTIPNEVYNAETGKIEKSTLRMREVVIEDKYVNHQTSMNDFVLEFQEKYKGGEYYDEKWLSDMQIIRPDGLIRVGNIDLFLEQDMGTESHKQLCDKWYRYRRYLSTSFTGDRKIVVLFILKCKNIKARKDLVRKSILETFTQINSSIFDIYIGDKDEMLDAALNEVLVSKKERTVHLIQMMQRHSFKVSEGSKLKAKLGTVYDFYIALLDKQKRLNYYHPNKNRLGVFTEFLVDFYDKQPISVLSKIYFHHKNAHNYDIAYSPKANLRLINYIVIVNDIHDMYEQLVAFDLVGKERVFFTTPERLSTKRINQAIFTFDMQGNLMVCPDLYFEPTIKEGNIRDYQKNGLKKR